MKERKKYETPFFWVEYLPQEAEDIITSSVDGEGSGEIEGDEDEFP